MSTDVRNAIGAVAMPGDESAVVSEVRRLLGMPDGPYDEALRVRWRGWLEAVGYGPCDYMRAEHLATLRRVRRERGDAMIGAVVGAIATGAPVIVAVSGRQFGDGVIWVGAVVAALTAIGIGAGKVWRLIRGVVRELDKIEDLVTRAERVELRQLAMQEQLRDVSERLEHGIEQSRRIFDVAEQNRLAAEEHGIDGLRPLPTD